jgi:hypothetical protein
VIAVSPVDVAGLPGGQGWRQAGELGLALALSACVDVDAILIGVPCPDGGSQGLAAGMRNMA